MFLKRCFYIETGFNKLKTSPKTLAFDPQIMGNLAQRKCSFIPKLLFMLFYKNPKSV